MPTLVEQLRKVLLSSGFTQESENTFCKRGPRWERTVTLNPSKRSYEDYYREYPSKEGWSITTHKLTLARIQLLRRTRFAL